MVRRHLVLDLAIVLAIVVGCTLEVWAPRVFGSTHMTGPRAAVYAAYVVAAVALVWRRRDPLAAVLVATAAVSAEWLAFGSPEGFGVFTILVVAGYSVAAHEDRRRALIGLAAVLAAGAVWIMRDPMVRTVGRSLGGTIWMAPAVIGWLLGAYLRTRRLYLVELQERAERAEVERDERAAAAVASERARIARELHDIVAHNVSVMVVQAEAADEMLDRDQAGRARAPVQRIQETGRSALSDMRRLLGLLREVDADPVLTPQPGIANLELLLAKTRDAGLPVELRVQGTPEPLPPGIDLSAFRIVQEALTNTLKYAGPARACVDVRYTPGALELEVSDDGIAGAGNGDVGHGLVGMRERVALFGGELDAGPAPDGGFRVRARLPLGAVT
jgi:signal transduction histidine kinase